MIIDGYLIYNKLRAGMSEEFQQRIPKATKETLASVGGRLKPARIGTNAFNEVYDELVNRLVVTTFEMVTINNPLEDEINRNMEWGDLIQNIAVRIGVGRDFAVTEQCDWSNDYIVNKRPVTAEYHRKNFRMQWWVTTYWDLAAKAFDSNAGFSSLNMLIVGSLMLEMSEDVYLVQRELRHMALTDPDFLNNPYMRSREFEAVVNEETAKQVLLGIKNIMLAWTRTSGLFNMQRLVKQVNSTAPVTLQIRGEFANYLSTEVWSSIFNPQNLGIGDSGVGNTPPIRVKFVENFGGIYPTALDSEGTETVRIYPVYGTNECNRGMVIGWRYTENDADPAIEDLQPTGWVDPHENTLAILSESGMFFGAQVRQDMNVVRSVSGRYDNNWLYRELLLAYSGFANMCEIRTQAPPADESWFEAPVTLSVANAKMPMLPDSEELEKIQM